MTGMAALSMCAAFTSCSKDKEFELITPEKQSELNYENAFKSKYGDIDPTHSWGFDEFKYKAGARTRAINVNGNLWEETPECTDAEAQMVFNYVNMTKAQMTAAGHKFTEVFPKNIENYFVTQVWTGTDTYNSVDGTNTNVLGSSHMDHLNIAMDGTATLTDGALSGKWEHINNFNASSNMNYGGNTFVYDGGTLDFAYNCSEDSRYHNRWIAVNGADVDPSLAGKYYVCFDFEAVNPEAYTNFRFKVPGINPGEWTEKGPYAVSGAWTVETATAAGVQVTYEEDVWNSETNSFEKVTRTYTVGQNGTTDWKIDNVVGGNKVYIPNDVYTDWIVRIVEAQPAEEPFPAADVRVLAEDLELNQTFNGQKYEGDFDFNDVVFDVIYNHQGATWIIVQAAGGTYPLYVDGNEVHAALGSSSTNVMIHTDGSKGPSKPIKLSKLYTDANDITVTVDLPSGTRTLEAGVGKAPHKLAVSPTFDWMSERVSIEEVHPNFSNWVKHSDARWY